MSPPGRKSPGANRGSDLRWEAGDRSNHSGTRNAGQTAVSCALVYTRETWKPELPPRPARPAVNRRGNVIHVNWKPKGFTLVELTPGEFALAWHLRGGKIVPFSNRGAPYEVAAATLDELVATERRPVFPPHTLGGAA